MKKQITAVLLAAAVAVTSFSGFGYFFSKDVTAKAADNDGTPYDPVLTDDKDTVIVLDPGHGGSDSGATGNGYKEKNLTLKIANAVKARLEQYANVKVYMSRTTDTYVGLTDRTNYAASVDADAFVSIHLNSSTGSAPHGCEIYYPNNHYDTAAFSTGKTLATNIRANLLQLGLFDRGLKTKTSKITKYKDGSLADYYAVIRGSKNHHIPGIIVEGAFISSPSDVDDFLSTDEQITAMGNADADGIAATFDLSLKNSDAPVVYPDAVTLNSAEASADSANVTVSWQAAANANEYIVFRKNGQNGTYKEVGRTSSTSFTDTSGSYGSTYYYTVVGRNNSGRSQSYNTAGVSATTPRHDVTMESAVDSGLSRVTVAWKQISGATGYRIYRSTNGGGYKKIATIKQNVSSYTDESVSKNTTYDYTVKAYVKTDKGNVWGTCLKKQATVTTDSDTVGTLTGVMAADGRSITFNWDRSADPDVTYRLYKKTGDGSYTKVTDSKELTYTDSAIEPGTTYKYRLRFYRKSVHSPYKKTFWSSYTKVLTFTTAGDGSAENQSSDTQTAQAGVNSSAATAAEKVSKAVINWRSAYTSVKSSSDSYNYDADENDYVTPASETSLTLHWYPVEGVTGYQILNEKGKRVASVRGDDANEVTVNGLKKRTSYTYTVRAFIKTDKNYFGPNSAEATGTTAYAIKGTSSTNVAQMVRYYNSHKKSYPSDVYSHYGAKSINEFAQIVYDEANKAGIKAEVLFAQICNETGFLQFGGDVQASQCNFGGIGATGGGAGGMDFVMYARYYYSALGYATPDAAVADAVRVGIRAQATHLALYASNGSDIPSYSSVPTINGWPSGGTVVVPDPRASSSIIGTAPYVEWLGIKDNQYTTGEAGDRISKSRGWATANNYGYTLINSYITPLLKA